MQKLLALVVEDEWLLMDVVQEELLEDGFEVATAVSGEEAIVKLEAEKGRIACLLTDIRLGAGIDGWEVARRARQLQPGLPVVYMTGDSASNWVTNGVPESVLLSKPFALSQLTAALTKLVNNAY